MRKAGKDYPVPGTNHLLTKGTAVFVSIYAIHHDPEYYPEPQKFDPERFVPQELSKKRNQLTYIPFGEGPRNCIALRFGMMQARIGLVTLLRNFELFPTSRTVDKVKFSMKGIVLQLDGGLWLGLKKLHQ